MNLIEKVQSEGLRSADVDDLIFIVSGRLQIENVVDIIKSYEMITSKIDIGSGYYKYKLYLPYIDTVAESFKDACNDFAYFNHDTDDDDIYEEINNYKYKSNTYYGGLRFLCFIFIYVFCSFCFLF